MNPRDTAIEALEYALREAEESGKHFSPSTVDRLNAKEYVNKMKNALAALRSEVHEEKGVHLPKPVMNTNAEDLMMIINQNLFRGPENMEAKITSYINGNTRVIK